MLNVSVSLLSQKSVGERNASIIDFHQPQVEQGRGSRALLAGAAAAAGQTPREAVCLPLELAVEFEFEY